MNTNCIDQQCLRNHVCCSSHEHNHTSKKPRLKTSVMDIIQHLLLPENTDGVAVSINRMTANWADVSKTLFWVVAAIGIALLIGQLGK